MRSLPSFLVILIILSHRDGARPVLRKQTGVLCLPDGSPTSMEISFSAMITPMSTAHIEKPINSLPHFRIEYDGNQTGDYFAGPP